MTMARSTASTISARLVLFKDSVSAALFPNNFTPMNSTGTKNTICQRAEAAMVLLPCPRRATTAVPLMKFKIIYIIKNKYVLAVCVKYHTPHKSLVCQYKYQSSGMSSTKSSSSLSHRSSSSSTSRPGEPWGYFSL